MVRYRSIRASDDEREYAVAVLRRHYADGRLSSLELETRAMAAYGARRRGELARLLSDLPAARRPGFSRESIGRVVARVHRFLLRGHAAMYGTVNAVLIGVWALLGEGRFWPAIYLVPSTALLLWHWAGGRMLSRALLRSHSRSPAR